MTMTEQLDTSWIDEWFPSVDGIRAKSVREKAIPEFIQKKIDAKKGDDDSVGEEDGEAKKKEKKKP